MIDNRASHQGTLRNSTIHDRLLNDTNGIVLEEIENIAFSNTILINSSGTVRRLLLKISLECQHYIDSVHVLLGRGSTH